ncbi:hypothetical protein AAFF_G00291580 [Aldrovandia affinis]|uniref:CCHC-type domain-containing protein n=1 Tax=Aldrovandia affinis TaxID=143900 RepID=A0AAD7SRK7_9TELE|nr:hypothetical protein AAFF_G00291580 [Aldrovandia affinis]
MRTATADDNVMGARVQPRKPAMTGASEWGTESVDIVCFRCGQRGHIARVCQRGQQWYSQGSSTMRRGRRQRQDNACGVSEETDENTYAFLVSETQPGHGVTRKGLMVDTGATSHIITDLARFKSFDDRFQAETHCVELADGTRCKGVAERRGDAEVCLVDSRGRRLGTTLRQALYIPSYPQDIFSVRAATSSGATVIFKDGEDVLQYRDGRRPNVSRMQKFGSVCYAYRQDKRKLDSRSDKGIFIGYDKNSPAYMVYYPDSRKVKKHRLVRFMSKTIGEQQTQTDKMSDDDDDFGVQHREGKTRLNADVSPGRTQDEIPGDKMSDDDDDFVSQDQA